MINESLGLVHERPPLMMSIPRAAKELGVSASMVETLIRDKLIRPCQMRTGGERRISYPELLRYVAERDAAGIER